MSGEENPDDRKDDFRDVLDCMMALDEGQRDRLIREVRALDSKWSHTLSRILEQSKSPTASLTLADQLQERFGSDVDPRITVDRSLDHTVAESPPDESAREVLDQLRSQSPRVRRYETLNEAARGSMGVILRVWDKDLRRPLAMKVMLDKNPGDRSDRSSAHRKRMSRFLEEAQITGQLEHPGIVPVHELGIDEQDRLFFTMQLVKGRTLKEVLDAMTEKREGFTQTRVLHLILRTSEAVAYAHSRGVIHRDLKPSNIMVGEFGETYVMDWGIAKVLDHKDNHDVRVDEEILTKHRSEGANSPEGPLYTMDGDVIGTPVYMSPEQATGHVDAIGPRSDVYSLGAVLYQTLAGQMPYLGRHKTDTQESILRAVRQGPPTPLSRIDTKLPPELVAICEKAMARSPEDRYQSMEGFVEDLRAYLDNRVVRAYQVGAIVEFRKWVLRNKGMAAGLVAALTIGLASLLAINHLQRRLNLSMVASNKELRDKGDELIARAKELEQVRDRLQDSLGEYRRMADIKIVRDLLSQEKDLWPRRADKVEAMAKWISAADDVLGRNSEHLTRLSRLKERLAAIDLSTMPEEAWRLDVMTDLVSDLARLEQSSDVGRPAIQSRFELASRIEEKTVLDYADRWEEVLFEISDDPIYGDMNLSPIVGLVPLDIDPESGLWEFWLWESGARPERDENDRLIMTRETGMVFVLLPPTTFMMGASKNADSLQRDPQSSNREEPPHEVSLDGFFLSKYEMTQGQWQRIMGVNPSHFKNEDEEKARPVEQLRWHECVEGLGRLGLVLPTEAQWEFAARGNTEAPWFTGTDPKDLRLYANIADQSFVRAHGATNLAESWDDGWPRSSPVDALLPNPFGFHHILGNVIEWCRDEDAPYTVAPHPGDGFRPSADGRFRMTRGGSFRDLATLVRVSSRVALDPHVSNYLIGLRPAMLIER